MTRLAILIGALVLVLSACASGKHAATPPPPRTVSPQVAALSDPEQLLRRVALPPGAEPSPQYATGLLAGSIGGLGVGAHRVYAVAMPYRTVLRFFERQHPRDAVSRSNLLVGRVRVFGPNRELTWRFPAIPHLISSRMLSVTIVRLRTINLSAPGWIGIRIESTDIWSVRPQRERIPAGVRQITIRRSTTSDGRAGYPPLFRRVSDSTKVQRIVRWFDALQLFRGAYGDCPASFWGPLTVVDFRAGSGRVLAQAAIRGAGLGGACGTGIGVTVLGRPQPPLAGNFLPRVLALLGVRPPI